MSLANTDLESTRRSFLTSDGVRIAYRSLGEGDVVIVCHGGPSTTHEYLVGDLRELAQRLQIVFHDYRGSGGSAIAPAETYTFERLADDVDELRAELGVDQLSVLAHSMGGFVALHYALKYPSHCSRLALIDCSPAGTISRTAVPTLQALGPIRIARLLGRSLWYAVAWSWRTDSEAKTSSRYSMMHIMQEGKPSFRKEVARREVLVENDNAPSLERLAFQTDMCELLPQIACPALIIHGSKDAPFVAGAALLERGLRDHRRVELKEVGHHPLVEEHARTIKELTVFLAGTT